MSGDTGRQAPSAAGLAFMLVALVVLGTVLGYFADGWLHTRPWLMVAGVFVGAGLGFAYMVMVFLAGSPGKDKGEKDDHQDKGPD
jgi:F0F1-type ATP synthase assembly protein I